MTGMVQYQEWVEIVFDTAEDEGYASSFERNATVIQVAAEIWQDRKKAIRSASNATARQIAAEEIEVK